jgi:hypothetical protein
VPQMQLAHSWWRCEGGAGYSQHHAHHTVGRRTVCLAGAILPSCYRPLNMNMNTSMYSLCHKCSLYAAGDPGLLGLNSVPTKHTRPNIS